ncbi:MAG TPA: AAA family ATPase [Acidimicrobiales bacterium]|nr:AAA family ATPase [Acidimicrobiales bacterium]
MSDWPLVGRDDELRMLRDLVTGRAGRGLVLAGTPGVGKTRLGQECLRLAEQAGLVTAQVTATRAAAQLPFGALAPLLPVDPPPDAEAEAGAGAGTGAEEGADILRRSVAALEELSGGDELLLFVDDAHLLDDASATLVHQLATTGTAIVLATVRAGEAAPDPVVTLWKDGLARRVEVAGLDADAVGELLATVLDGQVDPATSSQFAERCQGNALFLHELVLGALDDGTLHDDDGVWRLQRPLSPSARLVEIVDARLGSLDERERALLELVAYGEPIGHGELSALADTTVAEALERRELIRSDADGRRLVFHLAHPLYGDVVRAHMTALRARVVARSLADVVEATGALRREDTLRVAAWRLEAGGGRPELLLDGATIARWRHDFPLAERLARAAVDAGAGFEAALLATQLASFQGRTDEAETELAGLAATAATDTATSAIDDAQRGRIAVARFDNAWTGLDLQQVLDDAEAAITDPEWLDQIAARRVSLLVNTQGFREAAAAAEALLARASGEVLVFASIAGGYSLARLGRLDAAMEAAARGDAAVAAGRTRGAVAWYPWWPTVTRIFALLYAGRFPEAEELIATHHQQALADRSAEAQAVFALLSAVSVGDRGHVRSAARAAREALAVDLQLNRPLLIRGDRIHAALALALGGRADEAADELRAVDALRLPRLLSDEVDRIQAHGWTAAAGGDIPGACQHLQRAADLGEEIGDLVGASEALHGLARLGRATEVHRRLHEVAARIDGDLAPRRAAHAEALAHGDAAALEKVSLDFETMGADLLAAEASADAAVARRHAGERREATAAERRAAILVERCEDPVTPALQRTEARVRLTPAERETAVLAASGRSNKQIAEQLILSPRTVENRLQRTYQKLGISGRTDLPDALALPTD